jgi:hypothetical protein
MATRNLAIMFTDIKGFTERTSGDTRQGMTHFLSLHERLLVPVFRYFKGTIVERPYCQEIVNLVLNIATFDDLYKPFAGE